MIDTGAGVALQCVETLALEVDMGKFVYVDSCLSGQGEGFCISEEADEYIKPCVYCGLPGDSVDHIPPRSLRRQLLDIELVAMKEMEVPACRECNAALGARPIITITERREYIKKYLRRRYASYIRIPNWTAEELSEFGNDLRGMICRNMAVRDCALQRIAWR